MTNSKLLHRSFQLTGLPLECLLILNAQLDFNLAWLRAEDQEGEGRVLRLLDRVAFTFSHMCLRLEVLNYGV